MIALRRSARGYSIVETIVAGLILSMLIVLIFNLFPSSMLAMRRGQHTIVAEALARTILESRKAGPFSKLDTAPTLAAVKGDDGVVFTPSYSSVVQGTRLRQVRVTVSWMERERPMSLCKELWICDIRR